MDGSQIERARHETRVLLVEDNAGDAELARAYLEVSLGPGQFEIEWVTSVRDAKKAVARSTADVCVVDANLRDGGWRDLAPSLRAANLPFVLLTGLEDPQEGHRALCAGAQDFLVKSRASQASLQRSITHALHRAQVNTSLSEENQRLEHLSSDPSTAVLVVDGSGRVHYANPQARNNPAAAIVGALELARVELESGSLTADRLDANVTPQLEAVVEAIQRLCALMSELHDDARASTEEVQPVDLGDVVGRAGSAR